MLDRTRAALLSAGVFLGVLAVYIAASPGRIDIIDGQYRFEVARNIVDHASIQIHDRFLGMAARGTDGAYYSPYGISGSLVTVPLILAARLFGPASIERAQTFFSFTSAVLSAGTAAVLLLFYATLGIPARKALFWTLIASFATLAFPAATTVFDQAQQAFFVIVAFYLAFLAARRRSILLSVAAGATLAILVNFQEAYVVLFPAVALATFAPPGASSDERRESLSRCAIMFSVAGLGFVVWAALNDVRFGSFWFSGKGTNHPFPFGNPLVGLAGLVVSPGKSIFLYSPPIALSLIGMRELVRREWRLGQAVRIGVAAQIGLTSVLSFFGGDWCWGPRYFVPILPLLALAFPFAKLVTRRDRIFGRAILVAGLVVQLLALGVDHHRFFYARSLPAFFWYRNEVFYFRQSALFARPGEILDSIEHGVPAEAREFRPGPYPELLTYAVFGEWGYPDLTEPLWMRHYRVFWLPRPWIFWMRDVPAEKRPINMEVATGLVLAMALAGVLAIGRGLGINGTKATEAAETYLRGT